MLVFVLGSVMLGVVLARSIVAESDAHRRSGGDRWWFPDCATCGGALGVSMMRCTQNRHPQPRRNVLVTVITGTVFGAIAATVPSWWVLPAFLSFGYFAVLLTLTDLDTKLIPNRILLPATIGGSVLLVGGALPAAMAGDFVRAIAAAAIYFAVMFALALVARGALGMGDVKLAFHLGLFAGFLGWGYLIIAGVGGFLLGGVVSIGLLISRRVGRKDAIPFGPFMTSAAVVAVIFGDAIIDWYLR